MTIRYSPVRHPESNPVERVMREIGKYCKIYCHTTQNKWPVLIPKIESWLNTTISGSIGFTPVELMFNEILPDIFSKIFNKTKEQQPNNEELQDKITLAYLTLKKKATKRKRRRQSGSTGREPELNKEVLLKCQPTSDTTLGITSKFMRPFDGLWVITKIIPPSCYKISDKELKIRGTFYKTALKKYLREPGGDRVYEKKS